jgi:hypothetical protein
MGNEYGNMDNLWQMNMGIWETNIGIWETYGKHIWEYGK